MRARAWRRGALVGPSCEASSAKTTVAGVVAWLCVIGRVPLPYHGRSRKFRAELAGRRWSASGGDLYGGDRGALAPPPVDPGLVPARGAVRIPDRDSSALVSGAGAVQHRLVRRASHRIVASSIVLIVLLYEITALYGALLSAVLGRRREREARMMTGDAVAGAIVHEIRQPLTAMVTSADAGLRFLDRPDPNLAKAKDAFTRIVSDGHRAGEVVASIRANFRSDVGTRSVVDINGLIDEALTLAEAELEENRITVRIEKDAILPSIRGNRVQLQQVLLNLITNAIEAMKSTDEGRLLSIRSSRAPATPCASP